MSDIFEQLRNKKNTTKKVKPRVNDGFVEQIPEAEVEHLELVETSKPKLVTLECGCRDRLDRILFEHKEVSWDTFIEAALTVVAEDAKLLEKTLDIAADKNAARKRTSVIKRTRTMAKKFGS